MDNAGELFWCCWELAEVQICRARGPARSRGAWEWQDGVRVWAEMGAENLGRCT